MKGSAVNGPRFVAGAEIAPREGCRRVAFPPERRLVLDTLRIGQRKHMMHGLLEVDVTRARSLLWEHRERSGGRLSFTAFVLARLGRAVAAHPEVHVLRDWFGRSVLFEDVDVTPSSRFRLRGDNSGSRMSWARSTDAPRAKFTMRSELCKLRAHVQCRPGFDLRPGWRCSCPAPFADSCSAS
ncbi:MAG: hypothetical protein ABIQ16_10760, partial [Polyangiaceae bacterium]